MLTVEKQEQIRRAYFIEEKSIRAICSDLHCAANTIRLRWASLRHHRRPMTPSL